MATKNMAPLYDRFDYASLAIEPATRGSRLAPIYSSKSRAPPTFQLSSGPTLLSPFGASAFEEGQTRLSIIFHIPAELADFFDKMDNYFIKQVAARSVELLRHTMSEEEVRSIWRPAVTCRDGYPPQLCCKYNMAGNKAVRHWTAEGAAVEIADPRDLRNHSVTALVKSSGFWAMGVKECGVAWDVVSMLLGPSRDECPFEIGDE